MNPSPLQDRNDRRRTTLPSSLRSKLIDAVCASHFLAGSETTSYSVDWTGAFRGQSPAVLRPRTTEQVASVLSICAESGCPVVIQGGNTGLVGGGVPLNGEIVLSTSRLTEIQDVHLADRQITASAGNTLHQVANAHPSLDFGVKIASGASATVGGAIATNAGGVRVLRYGPMRSQIRGIEVVLSDGTVLSHMQGLTKDNTGYDYPSLLAGSEGTLAVITKARLQLVPRVFNSIVILAGVESIEMLHDLATQATQELSEVISVEFFTSRGLQILQTRAGMPPLLDRNSRYYLLLELAEIRSDRSVSRLLNGLPTAVATSNVDKAKLWAYRERQPEAAGFLGTPIKLDVSVPATNWVRLASAAEHTVRAVDADAQIVLFGHIADGNLHVNIVPSVTPDGRHQNSVFELVASLNGSISAEHGIGILKAPWLHLVRSPAEQATFARIRNAFDPAGILNPSILPRLGSIQP